MMLSVMHHTMAAAAAGPTVKTWPLPTLALRRVTLADMPTVAHQVGMAECAECGAKDVVPRYDHQWMCPVCRHAFDIEMRNRGSVH